jgi:hypothetical protein
VATSGVDDYEFAVGELFEAFFGDFNGVFGFGFTINWNINSGC